MAFKLLVILLGTAGVLMNSQTIRAAPGLLFNISATGAHTNQNITLCLNGKGALSCQNYTISALTLDITTAIPNHTYPAAGIKLNTSGYLLEGCVANNNGYCLFSVSNTAPARIILNPINQATLTPNSESLALSVNCPTGTTGCMYVNDALTGTPRQITIKNNGSVAALNVSVTPSGLPSGTSITASSCQGTLEPAHSCTINITPGRDATSGCTSGSVPNNSYITLKADNVSERQVNVSVLSYGCIYQGGYVYSINDTTINTGSIGGRVTALVDQILPTTGILWSADSSGSFDGGIPVWGIDEASTLNNPSPNNPPATLYPGQFNCNGATDGLCNTNNIYAYYSTYAVSIPSLSSYAAGICKQYFDGQSDWYLPSICEMGEDGGMICTSPPLLQLEQNMAANLPMLLDNCTGPQCLSGEYWSSTEQEGNPEDNAWSECFASNGASDQCIRVKSELLGVRCSRMLTY